MPRDRQLRCNFCGKDKESVKKLVAGPSAYICDECVLLCVEILMENKGFKAEKMLSVKRFLLLEIGPFTPSDMTAVDEVGFDAKSFLSTLAVDIPTATSFGDTVTRINEAIQGRITLALQKRAEKMDAQIARLEQEAELLAKLKEERALISLKLAPSAIT